MPTTDPTTDPASGPPAGPPTPTLTLPVLPTPGGVVFPDMVLTVALESDEAVAAVDAAGDGPLLLVPRVGERFARVGTVAHVEHEGRLPNGTRALTLRAERRAVVGAGVVGATSGLWVEARPVDDRDPSEGPPDPRAVRLRAVLIALLDGAGAGRFSGSLPEAAAPSALADAFAYWPELSTERRVELLETVDVGERLDLVLGWAEAALAEQEVARTIRDDVSSTLEKDQRQALLRRQLAAIQAELGDGDGDVVAEYRERVAALVQAGVADGVTAAVAKEIDRLERVGEQGQEGSWIRTWLDEVLSIPWGERSDDHVDLVAAREVLDADHTGLDEVKGRIVEHLAVRKLRAERGVDDGPEGRRGGSAILALVGPPGVGKTSLGESVARALGRSFVRLALGGIRDEAEIRGHRRTYVGARPGRVVRALAEAGTMNPVVLLDEIDKVGADWRGDPAAALLEVLDPAQNHSFRDHYLEFELDLSDVVFLATANRLDTIPGPLLDRVEVIELDGYTDTEKATIATDHIVPRLRSRIGLADDEVELSDEVIARVIDGWTREAGVRGLERALAKLLRKAATTVATDPEAAPVVIDVDELPELLGRPAQRDRVEDRGDGPGVATGLAVTGVGGDVLFVEATAVGGEPGLTLTGQLGDVMKESAAIARSWLRAHADSLGIDEADRHVHVHFPAGAIPKDGPSAGITMATAMASLLTGRRVRPEVGMTGEITLQGRVLPIGGVKQKLLAAHRAGLREVVLPERNGVDLDDVPAEVRDELTVHLVGDIAEVLAVALEDRPGASEPVAA